MKDDLALFRGKSVLVVEDDFLLAEQTRRELERNGAIIVGPVPSVELGLELVDTARIDAAILDVNLDGEMVFPIADRLSELNIPFVFASGYDTIKIPKSYSGYVLCEKPTELAVIAVALFAPERFSH